MAISTASFQEANARVMDGTAKAADFKLCAEWYKEQAATTEAAERTAKLKDYERVTNPIRDACVKVSGRYTADEIEKGPNVIVVVMRKALDPQKGAVVFGCTIHTDKIPDVKGVSIAAPAVTNAVTLGEKLA